ARTSGTAWGQRVCSLVIGVVSPREPPAEPRQPFAQLAVRLWRLDRGALRSGLTGLGVPVLRWDSATGLEGTQAPLGRGGGVGALGWGGGVGAKLRGQRIRAVPG